MSCTVEEQNSKPGPRGNSLGPVSFHVFICGCAIAVLLRELSVAVVSGDWSAPATHCAGFSRGAQASERRPQWPQRSGVVAWRLSCSEARGILPDQGSNCVSCIGRRKLNHWTTRKVQGPFLIDRSKTMSKHSANPPNQDS